MWLFLFIAVVQALNPLTKPIFYLSMGQQRCFKQYAFEEELLDIFIEIQDRMKKQQHMSISIYDENKEIIS